MLNKVAELKREAEEKIKKIFNKEKDEQEEMKMNNVEIVDLNDNIPEKQEKQEENILDLDNKENEEGKKERKTITKIKEGLDDLAAFTKQVKQDVQEKGKAVKVELQIKIKEGQEILKDKQKAMRKEINEKSIKLGKNIEELEGVFKEKLKDLKIEIREEIKKIDEKFELVIQSQRNKINTYIRLRMEQFLMKNISKFRPILKNSLKDPYMPNFIKKLVDDIVDDVFPLVEEEIRYNLRLIIAEPYVYIPQQSSKKLIPFFSKFRSWYLYTTDPYDKSFWHKIQNPGWWIILIVSIFPYYGVQAFFFSIIFLMIHKNDEYQLVKYILDFKKFIFITTGCINGIIGYMIYFICSTINGDRCIDSGPGKNLQYYIDVLAFFLQIFLVWVSFLLLPCSKKKGNPKFKYNDEEKKEQDIESNCCCFTISPDKGGRMKYFMIYDLIISLITIGSFLLCFYLPTEKKEGQIKDIIFFCKILYGILSIPWLIFGIPLITILVTKARVTSYDSMGNCVPNSLKIKREILEEKEEIIDIWDLFDEEKNKKDF